MHNHILGICVDCAGLGLIAGCVLSMLAMSVWTKIEVATAKFGKWTQK